MADKKSSSFPLIPYKIVAKRLMTPAVLLILVGLGIWFGGSYIGLPSEEFNPIGSGLLIAGFLIVLYCQRARRSRVKFGKNRIVIHTPLYPIAISFKRIRVMRSSGFKHVFPADQQKNGRIKRYKQLYSLTVPILDLRGYPYPKWFMRLWLHPLLFAPNATALVFPVADWMAFSRTLDTKRSEWHSQRHSNDEFYGA